MSEEINDQHIGERYKKAGTEIEITKANKVWVDYVYVDGSGAGSMKIALLKKDWGLIVKGNTASENWVVIGQGWVKYPYEWGIEGEVTVMTENSGRIALCWVEKCESPSNYGKIRYRPMNDYELPERMEDE